MKYAVVHSNDPWLLARLATDLQMNGLSCPEDGWNDEYNPFSHLTDSFYRYNGWCDIGERFFEFHNHECKCEERVDLLELTSRNYISVLTQILNP